MSYEIRDETKNWRIIYRIDTDAIVDVFNKTTRETPVRVIETFQRRLSKHAHDGEKSGNG